jgi:Lrp/AsnC family transcriptional regulator, regulator for asnA, asnC and gidA
MSDSYHFLLDNINLMIINILREDSSMPFVEIAKKIGISDGTAHIRIRKLIDSGIISLQFVSIIIW